ncbi:MAG: DegV family protein [Actinobacteria bacterium]|nr:DegV family protein [Actinomycetota bacterium]
MRENLENLKEYVLVTDSASDISREIAEKYNINVVPIYIHYNGKEFKDGVDIDSSQIYTLQKKKKVIFTSSSPSPHDFALVYEKLLKEYKKIFSIHISSKLSAVITSARIARGLLKAEKRIKIFDSLSGAMGTGFMVLTAAKAIIKNYSYEKILYSLNFLRDNIKLYGTIDTLKYLRRSGRVPAIASLMSRILKIKPLLGIKNGVVEMIGIAVTRRGSLAEITRRVIKDFKKERWVIVSIIHTLSLRESEKIMKRIQYSLKCVSIMITECTPVIGAHTGPGLIGIIVSKLNREIADLFI